MEPRAHATCPRRPVRRRRAGVRLGALGLGALLVALLLAVLARSGVAHELLGAREQGRGRRVLRVWDWWSPSTSEKYATYFAAVRAEFERRHPDVEIVYQFVPFASYEQKMATGLAGSAPPDVFQSSVVWAEGFYDRGMLLPLNRFLSRDEQQRRQAAAAGRPLDPGDDIGAEAFLEPAWRHNTTPDGTVFGIPQILDADCLAWNLDLLETAAATEAEIRGMFARNPDGTPDFLHLRFEAVRDWAQFRRVVRTLSRFRPDGHLATDAAGQELQAGFALHAHGAGAGPFDPWCAANGSSFQDPAGTRALFAGPQGVEAMRFLLDLYWKDHVCPTFRRQLSDDEQFNQRHVACVVAGTYSGKYITRNTDGWTHFDLTAFPPGPHGRGPSTLAWGNMLVIARTCRDPDLAWDYIHTVCSLRGSLRLLEHTEQNSPRRDFYRTPEWRQMCERNPYLHNVARICACGKKLKHTQRQAVDYVTEPIFETLLLHGPEIEAGRGPYPSIPSALERAASAADRVYARYAGQVQEWHQRSKG